jgi:hypothetical protein
MFDGLLEVVTLLLALAIVIVLPSLATAALLMAVAALIIVSEARHPAEDAERSKETDR